MDLNKALKASEIAALTSGVESVLRRLIRVLIGNMSLARLEELVRLVYVEEAERRLHQEFADRSAPAGQLSLLTGVDSRQVNKVRSHPAYRERDREGAFMHRMTPTTHLLDRWSTDPELQDPVTGEPRVLEVFGEGYSVETIMQSSRFVRGVTPKAVAERLVLSGAAEWDEAGRLHMLTVKFQPSASRDVEGAIEIGFNAVGHLVDTVITNLEHLDEGEAYYQRAFWTNRLAPQQAVAFRSELTKLMKRFEKKGCQVLIDYEMTLESPSQITGGFGLYYFEDSRERS